jgi:peptide/nickel transport system substrate-binding protein
MIRRFALVVVALVLGALPAVAFELRDPPALAEAVKSGQLPPASRRLPQQPLVSKDEAGQGPGRSGGEINTLVASPRDTRLMTVYSYTRLVAYNAAFRIEPDILQKLDVSEGRIFTLHLRRGHRWSDGHPFTAEDFRYWWEDVANNRELSKSGPPTEMLVDGKPPKFEVIDEATVRYTWEAPNPYLIEAMARAAPMFIYRPAHYLKKFHKRYADPAELPRLIEQSRQPNWAGMHGRYDVMYGNDNPDMPRLEPWLNTTRGSAQRFVFVRNPYFHRVDAAGMQLPYLDRVILTVSSAGLIPSKSGLGESDLQARYLRFADYTFLRQGTKRFGFDVRLWQTGNGSQIALFPNLNTNDAVWRGVMREARFRRALSMAIDRDEINEIVYLGLATPSNNTVREPSPFYSERLRTRFATHDLKRANRLLDQMGLKARDDKGTRLLPDGRPMHIVIETAGESSEETDVLSLVRDHWAKIGVRLFLINRPRDLLRTRTFSGEVLMTVWAGIESAIPHPDSSPRELAPMTQGGLQWAKWGQYIETNGKTGQPCDMPEACELLDLVRKWEKTTDDAEQEKIWRRMLEIHVEQQFSIGIISGVLQPVVVRNTLRNVPKEATYAWHPAAFFGIYRPDLWWLDQP